MHIDDFGNEVRLSIDQRVPWRVALEILRLLKVERDWTKKGRSAEQISEWARDYGNGG